MIKKQLYNLFKILKNENLTYAFLRSYDNFLDGNFDKDIDIVIEWKYLQKFESIIYRIFNVSNLIIYKQGTWKTANQYIIYNFETKEKILLDVRKDYTFKGKVLIKNKDLVKNILDYKELKILNNKIETEMLIYHMFFKNRYKQKYIDRIIALNNLHEMYIDKINKQELLLNDIKYLYPDIEYKLNYKRSFMEKIHNKLNNILKFNNMPLTIVLLGPDGAGKSTVGIHLESLFLQIGINSDYFHFALGKNSLYKKHIPIVKANYKKEQLKEKIPQLILELYRSLMKVKREFSFTLKFIKYNNNYLSNIFKNHINNKISIIDRFPLTSCINKKVLKYESLWRKIIKIFILKPRIIIFLHADAEIIYKRKQELTELEIKNFMEYEISLIKDNNINYKVVDVSNDVESVAVNIMREIITTFPNEIKKYVRSKNE